MSHFPGSRHPYTFSPYQRGRGASALRGRGRGRDTGSLPETSKPVEVEVNHPPARFEIQGIVFHLGSGGSKLNRITSKDGHPETPPQHEIAGVKFYRTKGGNLLRQKEYLELEQKQRLRSPKIQKSSELCHKFSQTGSCSRDCRFTHDFSKVAACKTLLLKGECSAGSYCSLSHDLNAHRTPVCIYFLRGNCTNEKCQYIHNQPVPGALVCYDFARLGYCEAGSNCASLHVVECPDFANTGSCTRKNCHLPHVERAGQLRRRAGATNGSNANSDDNDSENAFTDQPILAIGNDDVSSATVFSQQADFISLGD